MKMLKFNSLKQSSSNSARGPISERNWFIFLYLGIMMFRLPILFFLHMDRVLRWVSSVTRFYNILFAIGEVGALILLVLLGIQFIGRGLK